MENDTGKKGKSKWVRYLGFGLIFLTWIIWGVIFLIPFLHLGLKKAAIATTVLLIATNIFYLGLFLVGKELAEKFNIRGKIKAWMMRRKSKGGG